MHVRIAIQPDGSVRYAVADPISGDYWSADAEWIGACFSGVSGTERIESVEVAGTAFECQPAQRIE